MKTTRAVRPTILALICLAPGGLHPALRGPTAAAEATRDVASRGSPAKRLAEGIVRSAGIRRGLCVQLNCTDGRLAAELASQGKFVVHGLATTQEAAERARKKGK